MDLTPDPERFAAVTGFTFLATEVLKAFVRMTKKQTRLAVLVLAFFFAIVLMLLADTTPTGKELARAIFTAFISALSAVLAHMARNAGPNANGNAPESPMPDTQHSNVDSEERK